MINTMSKVAVYFLMRYFKSPKKEWMRPDSVFMVLGIIISVATLTIAQSIFEGYERVLKNTILSANSHVYVFRPGEENITDLQLQELAEFFSEQPEVITFAPIIMNQAMVTSEGKVKGCLLRGIDWEKQNLPTEYQEFVISGSYQLSDQRSAVLGYRLARELNLNLGDEFKIISPADSRVTPMGIKPKEKQMILTGIYKSGMYEYDSKFLFLNLESAADFVGLEKEFSMLEIKLKPELIEKADYLAYIWERNFNQESYRYQISSWIDFNGNLFALLKLEKWVIFIILSFLILIASFNVVSAVGTSILTKRKELGIMLAFGTSSRLLNKIFVGKSIILSLAAIILGQLIGILLAVVLSWQNFFILKADVYFLEKINVTFDPLSMLLIFFISLVIVFIASLVPLKKITDLEITNILRF